MADRLIFDINKRRDESRPGAMLPSVRIPDGSPALLASNVDEYWASLHASIGDVVGKSTSALEEAAKALGGTPPQAFSYSTMSFLPDPANYGLMQWPGLNPESLTKLCRENVAPIVIIRNRVDDIARYSGLSTHPWKPGWRIIMREAAETPTRQDRDDIKDAENFIYNCSFDGVNDPRQRDAKLLAPFDTFLRGFVNDALTYDGWAIWTDMDSQGRVRAFANLPAGMIRLALPTRGYKGDPSIFAALVDETGTPVKPFNRNELVWRVRNVRNDPSVCGYGWPEPEQAVRLIQAFTGGIELNADVFVKNSIPNGMLLLKGDYFNQEQIDALMREWTNMKRGMSKMWGMPVMSIPEEGEVEVLSFMDMKGQELRYKDHMNMMMGLCCLVWRYPIRRLGMFVSGNHRDNQPAQDAAIEIQGADDPGLPPLLMHCEETINSYLLTGRWPRLRFEFMSKNPKEDARSFSERTKARTWKEARAESDLPALTTLVKPELRPLAEIMELAPEDPNKASVFQTVAVKMLEAMTGTGDDKDSENPGPPMRGQKDPAESQGHGHLAGIRRDSRAEKDSAAQGAAVSQEIK